MVILEILGLILLTLLKVLGLILLIIIALFLLLMFVPIKYNIKSRYYENEKIIVNISITWLFKLFNLQVYYKDKIRLRLKLFGRIFMRKTADSDIKSNIDGDIYSADDNYSDINIKEDSSHTEKKQININNNKIQNEVIHTYEKSNLNEKENIKENTETLIEKIKKFYEKILDAKISIENKIVYIYALIEKYFSYEKRNLYKKILLILKKIILHLLPKKLRACGEFGIDDIYTTGRIFAILAILDSKKYSVDIVPNFEEKVIKLKLFVKGRVFVFYILYNILKLVANKEFRNLIREVKGR